MPRFYLVIFWLKTKSRLKARSILPLGMNKLNGTVLALRLHVCLGIGTQGQVSDDRWIVRYGITYSANGLKWTNYTEDNRQKVMRRIT